ncbi:ninja-family protein [Musa troglodytarum]|uniref:Ninja-family protein n=1 Tax=Musa troglodytarum TaxID=320322 RepID=A0A9E7FEZ3_9LILI|nr:ninja-family protein [Musa troglodytarum]
MEDEAAERERELPSSVIDRFPRDLLRRLDGNSCHDEQLEVPGRESGEVELNLGLSLGGCFGTDSKANKLVRSLSIAAFSSPQREHEFPVMTTALLRTNSLPAETEEERRKRKELQSLKRFEAKRKRLEKRNCIKPDASRSDEDADGRKSLMTPNMINGRLKPLKGEEFRGVFGAATPSELLAWAAGSKSTAASPPVDVTGCLPPTPHGSVRASGSSYGVFEFKRKTPAQDDTKNASSDHSESIRNATSSTSTLEARKPITVVGEEDSLKNFATYGANRGRNMVGEMPCVSTRGDGPDGRKIEGFLHKYRKGEEVRIMCVCHGTFLTPAEFVKHAGGGDVSHPLRHIIVNPSPSAASS